MMNLKILRLCAASFEWRLLKAFAEQSAERSERMSELAAEITRLENETGWRTRQFKFTKEMLKQVLGR